MQQNFYTQSFENKRFFAEINTCRFTQKNVHTCVLFYFQALRLRVLSQCNFNLLNWAKLGDLPPVDLYMNFEKSSTDQQGVRANIVGQRTRRRS